MKQSNVQILPKFQPRATIYPGAFESASQAQEDWLESRAELLLGGGSVGSLKTSTAIIDGAVEYDTRDMHTIMFRKALKDHSEALMITRDWFSQCGATFQENATLENGTGVTPNFNGNAHIWRWPWGSTFQFAYCATDADVYQHQSQSYTVELWDESTRVCSEFMCRYLLTRLRSTNPDLFLRVRLGTNPGGPYADWQMKMFLGGVCPHCEPSVRQPGVMYDDAVWPSDQRSLEGFRTQFIFSRVTDHNLLGEKYIRNIRMQHAATAEALLAGCWRAFEGQYYDIWEPSAMVVKRQTIADKWYWESWVGCDYGFSGSSAVAYLFARDPDTKIIYCLDEYVSNRESVRDFARSIYERFARIGEDQEQPRKLHVMYLGVDSWNDRGDQHTLAGQMNEVLQPHGLAFTKAKTDRAGGSQLIYELLRSGGLIIADTCTLLQTAIESAEHDPKQPEAYLNVVNDPRSDARDGFRYGVYSHHREAVKPERVRVQERMVEQLKTGDLTSAMFASTKIREEEAARGKPQSYAKGSGPARRRQIADWEHQRNRNR